MEKEDAVVRSWLGIVTLCKVALRRLFHIRFRDLDEPVEKAAKGLMSGARGALHLLRCIEWLILI